ncbi:hypothetical protein ACLOJK_031649 [Asimina triloba]
MAASSSSRNLEETPTWAVAVVCFVLVAISIFIEQIIHHIGQWLTRRHKRALYESLEKIKAELMLMGFISLLLTVGKDQIAKICIPASAGDTWHPCKKKEYATTTKTSTAAQMDSDDVEDSIGRRLLWEPLTSTYSSGARRSLASYADKCGKGHVPLVSTYGIHQLHIFIFVLAVFHVLYCIITLALGRLKMRRWKVWERETKTVEYQFSHDPERFRFARETSFGRRHLTLWSRTPVLLWIAHLAPRSSTKFDFQKYIKRSLEEDFKVVVGISPAMWFFAVLFLMSSTHAVWCGGPNGLVWLQIILLVGTKLQVIITKMGLEILDRGDVVKGVPVVQPADNHFWFKRPRLLLFLIHFVLFQMGTNMKSTIFNDRVATALRTWHHTARKRVKQNRGNRSGTATPMTPMSPSRTMTPPRSSPTYLLRHYRSEVDSRYYHSDNERSDAEGSQSPSPHKMEGSTHHHEGQWSMAEQEKEMEEYARPPGTRDQHEIDVRSADFSFAK